MKWPYEQFPPRRDSYREIKAQVTSASIALLGQPTKLKLKLYILEGIVI